MFLSTIPNLSYVKKRRYRISLTFKNDNTESLLRSKTTIPNLSYVKKRQYRTFPILNTEQKRQYLRKNRKGLRRFWLEKTDNFLRLKTEDFSTRVGVKSECTSVKKSIYTFWIYTGSVPMSSRWTAQECRTKKLSYLDSKLLIIIIFDPR